jgi:hypothetical protein
VNPTKIGKGVILSTGSIMRLSNENTIIWGSGIRDRYQDIKPAKLVRAVRGPLTRKRLIEIKCECPPIYGDPGLLLPLVYNRKNPEKKYKLGLTPHMTHYEKIYDMYKNDKNVCVIDLRTSNIEGVIDEIVSCDKIASSSLHGIIVSNAYNIPVKWIKFDDNIQGDDTKFYDHFLAIGQENETYIDAMVYKKLSINDMINKIKLYDININIEKLIESSILDFKKGNIKKYIRYNL